jgi:hypothetical protein
VGLSSIDPGRGNRTGAAWRSSYKSPSSPTVASLSARFSRQIKRATAGTNFVIACKEGCRIKCADPVEARLTQCAAHFGFSPRDLFDALTTSLPASALPEEPFEIGPAPVPLTVIASIHHQRHTWLFHPPRAWPDRFECEAVVHVEVEVAAGAQSARNSTYNQVSSHPSAPDD